MHGRVTFLSSSVIRIFPDCHQLSSPDFDPKASGLIPVAFCRIYRTTQLSVPVGDDPQPSFSVSAFQRVSICLDQPCKCRRRRNCIERDCSARKDWPRCGRHRINELLANKPPHVRKVFYTIPRPLSGNDGAVVTGGVNRWGGLGGRTLQRQTLFRNQIKKQK